MKIKKNLNEVVSYFTFILNYLEDDVDKLYIFRDSDGAQYVFRSIQYIFCNHHIHGLKYFQDDISSSRTFVIGVR